MVVTPVPDEQCCGDFAKGRMIDMRLLRLEKQSDAGTRESLTWVTGGNDKCCAVKGPEKEGTSVVVQLDLSQFQLHMSRVCRPPVARRIQVAIGGMVPVLGPANDKHFPR